MCDFHAHVLCDVTGASLAFVANLYMVCIKSVYCIVACKYSLSTMLPSNIPSRAPRGTATKPGRYSCMQHSCRCWYDHATEHTKQITTVSLYRGRTLKGDTPLYKWTKSGFAGGGYKCAMTRVSENKPRKSVLVSVFRLIRSRCLFIIPVVALGGSVWIFSKFIHLYIAVVHLFIAVVSG